MKLLFVTWIRGLDSSSEALHPRAAHAVSQLAVLAGLMDMRLFLIVANGRTGTEIMDLAQRRGHKVTAFVRTNCGQASGVTRLAIVSAALLFAEKGSYFAFFKWIAKHHARELRGMESIVQRSGLDWTIARPPRLTPSKETSFRTLRDTLPPGSRAMSFRSVADFMLDAVERRTHVSEIVGLGAAL